MNLLLIFPGFILAAIITLYYERKIRNLSTMSKNKVHFYVARDKNNRLWLYIGKPIRCDMIFCSHLSHLLALPNHLFNYLGLNENDYDNLKWKDDPVEVFLNMED